MALSDVREICLDALLFKYRWKILQQFLSLRKVSLYTVLYCTIYCITKTLELLPILGCCI